MPTKAELEEQNRRLKWQLIMLGLLTFVFGSGGLFGIYRWVTVEKSLGQAEEKLANARTREATINAEANKIATMQGFVEQMETKLESLNLAAEQKQELEQEIAKRKGDIAVLQGTFENLSKEIKLDDSK